MKVLYCARCGTIKGPGMPGAPEMCKCGYCRATWEDPKAGKLLVEYIGTPEHVRVIGMSNTILQLAIGPRLTDAEWKEAFAKHAKECPNYYLFCEDKRNSWACPIGPGETGDVRWVRCHSDWSVCGLNPITQNPNPVNA